MGFSIQYRSIEPMHPARAFEIREAVALLNATQDWSACEPVTLDQQSDGRLFGASRPEYGLIDEDRFGHRPSTVASSDAETRTGDDPATDSPKTLIPIAHVLSELSRNHEVDWVLGHDFSDEPIGVIRQGVCDPELIDTLDNLGSVDGLLMLIEHDDEFEAELEDELNEHWDDDEWDDDDDDDDEVDGDTFSLDLGQLPPNWVSVTVELHDPDQVAPNQVAPDQSRLAETVQSRVEDFDGEDDEVGTDSDMNVESDGENDDDDEPPRVIKFPGAT